MTRGYTLSGRQNPLQAAIRALFLIAATIGGFFIFAASAAFALFVVIGLIILAFIVFAVFWLRAKIMGKPLMPTSKMYSFTTFTNERSRQASPANFKDPSGGKNTETSDAGPVLDAHKTPDGWSVDTE